MRNDEVLALFDRQLRHDYAGDGPGCTVERTARAVRQIDADAGAGGWCGVIWTALDDSSADAEIGEQMHRFRDLGLAYEWKLYSHDRPADLGERLANAGLVPQEPETLMVAEVAGLPLDPVLPEGLRIEQVRDPEGVELLIRAHREAFGTSIPSLEARLRDQIRRHPGALAAIVVLAGDRPVCAGRVQFHEGTRFASLWGGGTVAEWRGRGVYRATVAYRARLAAERGFEFLQVDASSDSRPILARLGFRSLSTTTPYMYEP